MVHRYKQVSLLICCSHMVLIGFVMTRLKLRCRCKTGTQRSATRLIILDTKYARFTDMRDMKVFYSVQQYAYMWYLLQCKEDPLIQS